MLSRAAKVLVFDLGTTNFKAALVDRSGTLAAIARVPAPVQRSADHQCCMEPAAFVQTVEQLLGELHQTAGDLQDVAAVSFATQANSFLLLDEADQPLTPLILWPDERARSLESRVQSILDPAGNWMRTGLPFVSAQMASAKLLWLAQHETGAWNRARRVCLLSDYLTLLMAGRHVTEVGVAGLSALADIHNLGWIEELCAGIGASPGLLPQIVRAGTDLGSMPTRMAQRWGLPAECRFVVGCLDQYAGAIGTGSTAPGQITETTGTVLATVRCSDRFSSRLAEQVVQGPAFTPGLYYQMTFGETSGQLLEWYRRQLSPVPEVSALAEWAIDAAPAPELRLASVPKPDSSPGQVIAGLQNHHTPGQIVRCLMDAVAEALAGQVSELAAQDAAPPPRVRSAGGAARMDFWLQLKANRLGAALEATECPEPTCLGAAMLAGAALCWGSVSELAQSWPRIRRRFIPLP